MEFDKSKVYTALNADESLIGAKGYFAESLCGLTRLVKSGYTPEHKVQCIEYDCIIADNCDVAFNFFYLVEPAPEKWFVYRNINGVYGFCNFNPKEAEIVFEGTKIAVEVYYEEHSKPKYRPFYVVDKNSHKIWLKDDFYNAYSYKHGNNDVEYEGSKMQCEQWVKEHSVTLSDFGLED